MKLKVKLRWIKPTYNFGETYTCYVDIFNKHLKIDVFDYGKYWSIENNGDDCWHKLEKILMPNKFETAKAAMFAVEQFIAIELSNFISEVTYEN